MRDAAIGFRIGVQQPGHVRFVNRVVPRVEETNGYGFGSAVRHLFRDALSLNCVQRSVNLAAREQPLLHLEDQMPRHQRLRTLEPDIVGVGPISAADLIYVACAFGNDQGGTSAFPFQYGVDRNRRSVNKGIDGSDTRAALLQAVANPVFQTCRSGRGFGAQQPATGCVIAQKIGEGSPDVNRDDQHISVIDSP